MGMYNKIPQLSNEYTVLFAETFSELRQKTLANLYGGFSAFVNTPPRFTADANSVNIKIQKGSTQLAPISPRGAVRVTSLNQSVRNEQRWTDTARVFPLIEETGSIGADRSLFKVFSESENMRLDRQGRVLELAMEAYSDMYRSIVSTHEYLASQSILTGKMPLEIGTTDTALMFNWVRDASLTTSAPVAWSTISALGYDDVSAQAEKIKGGNMWVTNGKSLSEFKNLTQVIDKRANRNDDDIDFSAGAADRTPAEFAKFIAGGMIPQGRVRTSFGRTLWVFTYSETYTHEGSDAYFVADGTNLICNSQARVDAWYGPPDYFPKTPQQIQQFVEFFGVSPENMVSDQGMMVEAAPGTFPSESIQYDAYWPDNGKLVVLRAQSAPIIAPIHANGFAILNT